MTDKEIFYQVLFREVDNFLANFNHPLIAVFSDPVKHYLEKFLDPYVDAFSYPPKNEINAEIASEFLKEEANEKIENFKKRFEKTRELRKDKYVD
jgi:hypothetical protein